MAANQNRRGMRCGVRLDIEFDNLSYYPPIPIAAIICSSRKQILRDAAGRFNSGRLTAILGPSGAGKTSLLNVLSGLKTRGVYGSIRINGQHRNVPEFRKLSCYVKEEFVMMELFTVRETMLFASDFKMDPSLSAQQKSVVIDEILGFLGLAKSGNIRVGNLSGGEKKKLSIGLELLTNPPVMFFDEPTSGLDSVSALQIISRLKYLAQGGRTVVCSIHQPSWQIFQMFDDVYVLSKGQCIYNGPNQCMIEAFQDEGYQCSDFYSAAHFAIEIASGLRGDIKELIAKFNNAYHLDFQHNDETCETSRLNPVQLHSSQNQAATVEVVHTSENHSQSLSRQIIILNKRSMMCTMKNPIGVCFRILAHIVVGLILGYIFFDIGNDASKAMSNILLLSFFTVLLFFCNGMSVSRIPTDIPVCLHEHLNNWYSMEAYYLSKLCADIPLQILCSSLIFIPGYFLSNQPLDGIRLLQFWIICMGISFVGHCSGLVAGAIWKTEAAIFTFQVTNVALLLFSGFHVPIEDIPVGLRWITDINYFRYAFEGAMQCIYGYDRPKLNCTQVYCHFKFPHTILEQFNMKDVVYEYDVLGLVIWIFVLEIVLLIVLKLRIYFTR